MKVNRDDCFSTESLHNWLEQKRKERLEAGDQLSGEAAVTDVRNIAIAGGANLLCG